VKRRKLLGISLLLMLALGLLTWLGTSDFEFLASANRIGVIEIRGIISDTQETLKSIKSFRENPNVKVILIRIETPGGGVGPSQEVYREVRRTVEQKPVVASLGSIAASGGYYIASATNRIIANPGTITGSIGVISYFPNLRELFEKVGYTMNTIKSGRFKDMGNPAREMTPQEREILQETIDEAHRQFIRDVAIGRNLSEEKVREIADGRILMGESALGLGLIDELGNYEDAVIAAAKLGKIEGKPDLVYAKKKKKSLLEFILGSELSDRASAYFGGSLDFIRYQVPLG
jgi:protease-4